MPRLKYEIFNLTFLASFYSIFKSLKVPKMELFAMNLYASYPTRAIFYPIDPPNPTGIVTLQTTVNAVLSMFNGSKIRFTIIKFVAIYMVGKKAIRGIIYDSVHSRKLQGFALTTLTSNSIAKVVAPLELANAFIVIIINNGLLALSKRNIFHKVIIPYFKASNNTLLVSTNSVNFRRFQTQLDAEHAIGLAQAKKQSILKA